MNKELLHEMFQYNKDTGVFTWKQKRRGLFVGDKAGCLDKDSGYIKIRINNKLYYAHRLAWLYEIGEWPINQIDHKNQIKSDNRIDNLRLATNFENSGNRAKNKNNTSGFKGVCWSKQNKKWCAQIGHKNKKIMHLGFFATPELAHDAYVAAATKLHGDFACWE